MSAKTKHRVRLIAIFLCLSVCVSALAACNTAPEPSETSGDAGTSEEVTTDGVTTDGENVVVVPYEDGRVYQSEYAFDDYKVWVKDGTYYLELIGVEDFGKSASIYDSIYTLNFDSLWDFYETVMLTGLTRDQLNNVSMFETFGIIGVKKILDMNALCAPVMPENYQMGACTWKGATTYRVQISAQDGVTGTYSRLKEETYRKRAEFFEDDWVITSVTEDTERGGEITQYTTAFGTHQVIMYDIETAEKTLHVQELYKVTSEGVTNAPHTVMIYGQQGEEYFSFQLQGLTARPSVEELAVFGVRPFDYNIAK